MNFARPWLLLLTVLPCVVAALVIRPRPKKREVLRFSDASLLRELKVNPLPPWRRRLALWGMLLGMLMMVISAAEPQRIGPIKSSSSTVVLALDVSRSMLAEDVSPNRYEAAKAAAVDFINAAPAEVNVGLVAFSSNATILAVPGTDRAELLRSVENIELSGGTAIGEAVFTSLSLLDTRGWTPDPDNPERSIQQRAGAIVVMSDGATNAGRPNDDASAAAKLAGVPVYTVAFGTPNGSIITPEGTSMAVPAEPIPLQVVSSATGGDSYTATTGTELSDIFKSLARTVAVEQGYRSVAHWFALAGLLLLFAAAVVWALSGSRM
jgi:Ca-activated chloride channel family protein